MYIYTTYKYIKKAYDIDANKTWVSHKYVLTRTDACTSLRIRTYLYQHTQKLSHICIIYKYLVCIESRAK